MIPGRLKEVLGGLPFLVLTLVSAALVLFSLLGERYGFSLDVERILVLDDARSTEDGAFKFFFSDSDIRLSVEAEQRLIVEEGGKPLREVRTWDQLQASTGTFRLMKRAIWIHPREDHAGSVTLRYPFLFPTWLKLVACGVLILSIMGALTTQGGAWTPNVVGTSSKLPTKAFIDRSVTSSGGWFLAIGSVLILAYGSVLISISRRIGRLNSVPLYDDCGYMENGLNLKNLLLGLPHDFSMQDFLHAPPSALFSFLGFVLVPDGYSGPYYANILILFFVLGWIFLWTRKLSLGWRLVVLVQFLSLPIAIMAVVELRPDMLWAFALGIAFVTIILDWSATRKSGRFDLWCGFALALPFFAKPTTFTMSGFVIALAMLGVAGVNIWSRQWSAKLAAGKIVRVSLFALLCLAPLILVKGKSYVEYFITNVMGENRDAWSYDASPLEQFL